MFFFVFSDSVGMAKKPSGGFFCEADQGPRWISGFNDLEVRDSRKRRRISFLHCMHFSPDDLDLLTNNVEHMGRRSLHGISSVLGGVSH